MIYANNTDFPFTFTNITAHVNIIYKWYLKYDSVHLHWFWQRNLRKYSQNVQLPVGYDDVSSLWPRMFPFPQTNGRPARGTPRRNLALPMPPRRICWMMAPWSRRNTSSSTTRSSLYASRQKTWRRSVCWQQNRSNISVRVSGLRIPSFFLDYIEAE